MRHRLLFTAERKRRAHMKQYRLAIEVPPYGAASAEKRMTAPEFFQRVFPDSILPRSSRGAVFYAASRHEKRRGSALFSSIYRLSNQPQRDHISRRSQHDARERFMLPQIARRNDRHADHLRNARMHRLRHRILEAIRHP